MSLDTAKDIAIEVEKRKLKVKNVSCICNRVDNEDLQRQIKETARNSYGLDVIGFIPPDYEISKRSLTNQNILDISNSPAHQAMKNIMRTLHL